MKKYTVNVVRQLNITKRVLVEMALNLTQIFHLRNVNFTHHTFGRN